MTPKKLKIIGKLLSHNQKASDILKAAIKKMQSNRPLETKEVKKIIAEYTKTLELTSDLVEYNLKMTKE